jgi:hypothetical protein
MRRSAWAFGWGARRARTAAERHLDGSGPSSMPRACRRHHQRIPVRPFHGEPVKTQVYAPDWRTDARGLHRDLIRILTALFRTDWLEAFRRPRCPTRRGCLPGRRGLGAGDAQRRAGCRADGRGSTKTGRSPALDIEPEPDCLLETSGRAVEYFQRWLQPFGGRELARRRHRRRGGA